MLKEQDAPQIIDFLSIDTEGAERFRRNGFTRRFESISCWDDWYINHAVQG
jgi:hypothetical protein